MSQGRIMELASDAAPSLSVVEHAADVHHSSAALVWRRFGDLVLGTLLLLIAAIPMLILAVSVKLTSRGPVLFQQDRVGKNGLVFKVLKFRTMTDGTHNDVLSCDQQRLRYIQNGFKLDPTDSRITPFGRVLRKTSLDELPQLINVIKGDMSLVGIRPLVPVELSLRTPEDRALYRSLRPGLTGLWQVEGRSTVGKVERLELDRRYVETWSPWRDVKILIRTPFAMLRTHHAH